MTNSPSNKEIIEELASVSDGVDIKFANFVWEQVSHNLDVSQDRVLEAVHEYLKREMAWVRARQVLKPVADAWRMKVDPVPYKKYIYIFTWGNVYKIGKSEDPERRLKQLNRGIPPGAGAIEFHSAYLVADADRIEDELHMRYDDARVIDDTGGDEYFRLTMFELNKIVEYLESIDVATISEEG